MTESTDLHDTVAQRLRRVEQRYTGGRRAIVEVLADAGHPVTIEDIASVVPQLPRSSAYRHLVDLQTAGVVQRVAVHDEFARFELAEDLTEHHHHLVCVNCGKVTDVTPPDSFEETVTATVDQLAASVGFKPQGHRIDVFGLCGTCA